MYHLQKMQRTKEGTTETSDLKQRYFISSTEIFGNRIQQIQLSKMRTNSQIDPEQVSEILYCLALR